MKEQLNYGTQIWEFEDVDKLIEEFLDLYEKRPIQNNKGGMLSAHLFWVWYVIKKLKPKNIIESGIFKGQGTWLFRQTCPEAKIFSIDPALEQRQYVDKTVTYFTDDFCFIDWKQYLDMKETFIFFDDHQNAYNRLMQMKWMGFSQAMFEDNYPENRGDCYSLKKVFAECGFQGNYIVPPNTAHANYVKKNIETYTTFPPLYRSEKTRWGDEWDNDTYLTADSILSREKIEKYSVIQEEAKSYTWICYIKLKE